MSQSSVTTVACPKCGHAQEFTTWNSINVALNPEKKAELKNGTLTRFVCEQCSDASEVNYPILYHDPEQQFMIWMNSDREALAFGGVSLGDVLNGYRLRLVESRNQLVEKTHIFENHFDDLTMELFKASMTAVAKGVPDGELLFGGLGKGQGDAVELQFAVLSESGTQFIGTTREAFEDTVESLGPMVDSEPLEVGKWHRIDTEWADGVLERFMPQDPS